MASSGVPYFSVILLLGVLEWVGDGLEPVQGDVDQAYDGERAPEVVEQDPDPAEVRPEHPEGPVAVTQDGEGQDGGRYTQVGQREAENEEVGTLPGILL